ncbi:MAG: ATP-binding protein [Planctomycetota bacterium]
MAHKRTQGDISTLDPINAAVLRTVVGHMPYRIFWKDADGFFLGCNEAFAQDAGFGDPAAVIGLSDAEMPWSPDETEKYRACDARVMASGEGEMRVVEPQHRPDGSTSWVETSRAPLRDAEGSIIGVLGMYRDVTDEREAKESLERALSEAIDANRSRSNFVGLVSHEVRTPMTAVLGFAEMIEQALGSERPDLDEVRAHLRTIKTNGHHLLRIVSDVLDLSMLDSGGFEVEAIRTPVPEILREAREEAAAQSGTRPLEVVAELATPIPASITSDPLRLRQVLHNIVGNAIKHTHEGEVRIVAGLYGSGAGADHAQHLRIDVVDSGCGIPEELIDEIFEPFTQGDDFLGRRTRGTGLGLSIARRLVHALGGGIACESVVGEGSTFTITIPVSEHVVPTVHNLDAHRSHEQRRRRELAPLSGRVLLAEDAPDSARLLTMMLEGMGLDVTLAEDGREAIDAARVSECPFDIVITDIQMPEVDGFGVARSLREAGYAGPLYALTAHALATHHSACVEAGCDRVLTKPISREALHEALSRALAGPRARRAA